MASKQTANFGLNQWEATDKVLREEFNADNQKIDAALSEIPVIATGSFIGDGTESRIISLPFTPRLVYVTNDVGIIYNNYSSTYYYSGGFASTTLPCVQRGVEYLSVVENGFQVVYKTVTDGPQTHIFGTNSEEVSFRYFAIK